MMNRASSLVSRSHWLQRTMLAASNIPTHNIMNIPVMRSQLGRLCASRPCSSVAAETEVVIDLREPSPEEVSSHFLDHQHATTVIYNEVLAKRTL